MKVAYLGPAGTFTEKAANDFSKNFKDEIELIPLTPIRRVILAVENYEVDYGVVPIENFYNGEVRETLDSLNDMEKTKIVAENFIEVVHCLGTLPSADLRNIKKILSKDQALEQCSVYLCEKYPSSVTVAVASTKEGAEIIRRENLIDAAAIGPEKALTESGLKIIDKNICPNNRTRFVLISARDKSSKPSGNDKTFLVLHPHEDKPGLLYKVLGFFSEIGINLEYIQSRPDGKKGYRFYLELEGHEEDFVVRKALEQIKDFLGFKSLKVLGSFKDSNWKNKSARIKNSK